MSERTTGAAAATPFDPQREYYALFDTVNDFDKRLLTVKGWSVTVSIAALGAGFQSAHSGLFLVAAITGLGFYLTDAIMKRHQMRYYARMRELEVQYGAGDAAGGAPPYAPRIDWGWTLARDYYTGRRTGAMPAPERYGHDSSYRWAWLFPNVLLPHAVAVAAGAALFAAARAGRLGQMGW